MASNKNSLVNTSSSDSSPSSIISLEKICTALNIPQQDVLYAFVLGSRLWGTLNAHSDYDAYIVISPQSKFVSSLHPQKGFASIHSANIDSIVMTEQIYKERLKECAVFDLVTMWLPPEFVLKTRNFPSWKLNIDSLVVSVEKVAARDVLMAQKQAENAKSEKTKKILIHTIRMIMMATQIVRGGRVDVWDCANHYFWTIMSSYCLTSWDDFIDEVLPIKNDSMEAFLAIVKKVKEATSERDPS